MIVTIKCKYINIKLTKLFQKAADPKAFYIPSEVVICSHGLEDGVIILGCHYVNDKDYLTKTRP